MLSTIKRSVYRAFGLNVSSDIPFPELPKLTGKSEKIDIVVEIADLTCIWSKVGVPRRFCVVNEKSIIFQVQNTATYLIENGNKIIVSPMTGSCNDQIRLYVLGSCMGALLMQRKALPFHGSAIAIHGKAYAIVGDSGAGKSTLASAFLNRGFQLLSDDVIPVSLSSNDIPIVTPAYPQQKLWQESLDAFGMASKEYRPIFDREAKFAVPVSSQFSSNSFPLAGVFELVKTEADEIEILPISSLHRLNTLFQHTYRNFLIDRLGLREWHFNMTSKIASEIQVFQLQRPINRFTGHDLTSLILKTINKE